MICGSSIFAMAIETSLGSLSAVEVLRLDPHLPQVVERVAALEPSVVLVERNEIPNVLALALLERGYPVLELDAEQGVLSILDRRQVPALEFDDLARAIEQVTAGDL